MNSLPLPTLGILASPVVTPGGSATASFDALLASAQPAAPQSADVVPVQGDFALAMPALKTPTAGAQPKPLKIAEQILSGMPESREALKVARFDLTQPAPVSAKILPVTSGVDAIAQAAPPEATADVTVPTGPSGPSPAAVAEPAFPALVKAGEQSVTAADEAEPEATVTAEVPVPPSAAARDLPRPKPLAVRTNRGGATETPKAAKPVVDSDTPTDTASPAPAPVLPEVIMPLPAGAAFASASQNAPLPETAPKAALSLPAQAAARSGPDPVTPSGPSRASASEAAARTEAQLVLSAAAPHKLKAGPEEFVLPGSDAAAQPAVALGASASVRSAEAAAPNMDQRALDLARGDQWLQQLASDIVSVGQRDNRLSFRLMPRTLGQLDVDLSHGDAGLSISMSAAHEDARAILSEAQPRLVEDIKAQGVRVAEARVSSGGADQQQNRQAARQWEPQIEFARDMPAHSQTPEEERRSGRFA